MFPTSALLRILGRTALVLCLGVAALWLVVRHALLPSLDYFRPRIQAELSTALGTPITLGRIQARWNGLHPHFEVNDVAVFDEHGNRVLALPAVRATLDWRSLLRGLPQFTYLEASGLHIEVRLDAQQRLWVLGQGIDTQRSGERPELALDDPVLRWLAQQPRVALRDASITWKDDTRDGTPLWLDDVTLGLVSQPGSHRLMLSASPPQFLGQGFELRAEFQHDQPDLDRTDPKAWAGMLYVNVEGMSPPHWRPWMDIPGHMRSGHVSAQWWLGFGQAQPQRVAAKVHVQNGQWQLGDDSSVQGEEVELFLDGSWQAYSSTLAAFETLIAPSSSVPPAVAPTGVDGPPVRFAMGARHLSLVVPAVFDHELRFGRIHSQGGVSRAASGGLLAQVDDMRVINRDMDLQWRGSWQEGGDGEAGLADMEGVFHRATLDGIDLYMPSSVNLEARMWLEKALLGGQMENARAELKGDLQHFPFGQSDGHFRIDGRFRDGIIDYAPQHGAEQGWPALREVNGRLVLDRVDLRLTADDARVVPAEGHEIRLQNVQARIPNIEYQSVLSIQGHTQAPASAYLELARHSPLQRLLDGFLDPAQADGDWVVPLQLTIPLLNVDNTKVQGGVQFAGGSVALDPQSPPFRDVQGRLEFSETGFSADALKARFLDGPVAFQGGIGGGRKGLEMSGRMNAKALGEYVGVQGMDRLKGAFNYKAVLRRQASGRYEMTARSDLRGLAMDLPAPAGKTAEAATPLEVQWTPAATAGDMVLKVALGSRLGARFLRRSGVAEGPYFVSGAVGTNLPETLPAGGLWVDARQRHIDVGQWNTVVDEFSAPAVEPVSDAVTVKRELFPALQRVRLQADDMHLYGLVLNAATLSAQRERPTRWRLDVSSPQTAGTLYWDQTAQGANGRVAAYFNRLSLGDPDRAEADSSQDDQAPPETGQNDEGLELPAVDLNVDKLTLYGMDMGTLAAEGVSEQGGRFWRLNKLHLSNPSAQLKGTGIWRLAGPERGLTVDAEVGFSDVSGFLDQLDFQNVMTGGTGSLKGRFEWRNMPWRFKRSDLNGQLRLELEKGRFSTVNSRSARLLELLSLQSLQRIATFNFNPASIFKEGFPFDRLAGTLHINSGVMTTNDYQVVSPVATISIGGDVDLTSEHIDLQAMVVPKLDVSGASIAAGIAINPIVGLGAFVTQWLLSKPLSKAMTVHYNVSGNLNDPQLTEANGVRHNGGAALEPGAIQDGGVELNDAARNGLHEKGDLK